MSTELPNPYDPPAAVASVGASEVLPADVRRPRFWTVIAVFIAAIVSSFSLQIAATVGLAAYLVSTGVSPSRLQGEIVPLLTSPGIFTCLVITGPGPFGVVALVAAFLSPEGVSRRLGLLPVKCSRSIYPLSMIGSILPLAVGLLLAQALVWLLPALPTDESAQRLYEQMTLAWAVPFVVIIGLVPGVCEEFLFRGYMQRRLIDRFGPVFGITVASVLFGCAHIMPHTVIFATILGLFFGVIAWKCGSIWPCICCHAFVNSGLNAWRMVIKFGEVPDNIQWIVTVGALVAGTVCFFATFWVLWRKPIL